MAKLSDLVKQQEKHIDETYGSDFYGGSAYSQTIEHRLAERVAQQQTAIAQSSTKQTVGNPARQTGQRTAQTRQTGGFVAWKDRRADRESYDSSVRSGYQNRAGSLTSSFTPYSETMTPQDFVKWRASIRDPQRVQADVDALEKQANDLNKQIRNARYSGLVSVGNVNRIDPQKGIRELNDELARIRQQQDVLKEEKYWGEYFDWEQYRYNPDFAKLSKYVSEPTGKQATAAEKALGYGAEGKYKDDLYEWINGNEEAGAALRQSAANAYGGDPLGRLFAQGSENEARATQMDPDDIQLFNYLYHTQGGDAAREYYDWLSNNKLNVKMRQDDLDYIAEQMEQHPVSGRIIGSAASVAVKPLSILSGAAQVGDFAGNGFVKNGMEYEAPYNKFAEIPDDVRNAVSSNWGKFGKAAYDLGMSMADFLYNSTITGGIVLGEESEFLKQASLAIMSAETTPSAVVEAKQRGLNDQQAMGIGVLAGFAEYITEMVSLETLLDKIDNNDWKWYLAKNVLAEGSEELASNWINRIADAVISRDKSEWLQAVQQGMNEGKTKQQAWNDAFKDVLIEDALSFGGGGLSGGIMAGSRIGIDWAGNQIAQTNVGGYAFGRSLSPEQQQALVETALESEPDSTLNRYAQRMQAKLGNGEQLTPNESGRLYSLLSRAMSEEENAPAPSQPYDFTIEEIPDNEIPSAPSGEITDETARALFEAAAGMDEDENAPMETQAEGGATELFGNSEQLNEPVEQQEAPVNEYQPEPEPVQQPEEARTPVEALPSELIQAAQEMYQTEPEQPAAVQEPVYEEPAPMQTQSAAEPVVEQETPVQQAQGEAKPSGAEMVREFANTLGIAAQATFATSYTDDMDASEYIKFMTRYYNEGKKTPRINFGEKGFSDDFGSFNRHLASIAYLSGQADGNREYNAAQNREPVNITAQNRTADYIRNAFMPEDFNGYNAIMIDGFEFRIQKNAGTGKYSGDTFSLDVRNTNNDINGGMITNARDHLFRENFNSVEEAVEAAVNIARNLHLIDDQQQEIKSEKPTKKPAAKTPKTPLQPVENSGKVESEKPKAEAAKPAEKPAASPEQNVETEEVTNNERTVDGEGENLRGVERDGRASGGNSEAPAGGSAVQRNRSGGNDHGGESSGNESGGHVGNGQDDLPSGNDPAVRGGGNDAGVPEQGAGNVRRPSSGNGVSSKKNRNNFQFKNGFDTELDDTRPNYDDNLAAIRLLKELEKSGKKPTKEQQAILAKFKGWGALKYDILYGRRSQELREILTPAEYATARGSIANAHYTSTKVISGVYRALSRMGFKGGNILEPSMGTGNFFGMLPASMSARSSLYGVELDSITGRIAQMVYPDAKIDVDGFQNVIYPENTFDAIVGNVPFDNTVHFNYRGSKYNLHDFFFVKGLDELKPGGVMALITSTGTLDKASGKTQNALASKANLIAAFRLPDNAFKSNAGTSVTTDLIFLQKKGAGVEDNGISFTNIGELKGAPINEYYVAHPENVLGRIAYEKNGMYASERTVVHAEPDFEQRFEKAIKSLPKDILVPGETTNSLVKAKKRGEITKATFYNTEEGTVLVNEDGTTKKLNSKDAVKASDFLKLKAAFNALSETERAGNTEAAEEFRKRLNEVYDSFVAKHGTLSSSANKRLLRLDDDYSIISGLELVGEKGKVTKSAIFTTPTLSRAKKTSAGSSDEALSISLNETGGVDIPHMAELAGKTEEQVLQDLSDQIIFTPDGNYQLIAQYASGNIYEKLAAVRDNPRFERNVKILEAALPTPKTAKEINADLGAHWIPVKHIARFAESVFETWGVKVEFNSTIGAWKVENFWTPIQKYSTNVVSAKDVLEHTLNSKDIVIYDKDDSGKRIGINTKQTNLAQSRQNDLREAFKKWIFSDSTRTTELEEIFNTTLNAYAPMDYKTLADRVDIGISPDNPKQPRDYQKEAVARIVFGGNTLLHHGVGTGKTMEMIMGAHCLKQAGIASKPMFVVPNGKVGDFKTEILELYPDASVLALDNDTMKPAELKRTKALIATGDWDYVLIYRSAFSKIPVSIQTQETFIRRQIEELDDAIREAKGEKAKGSRFEKNLEGRKKTLEAKLKDILSKPKDTGSNFEDLGVDALFVDEAHNFKKVGFPTTHQISGLDSNTNEMTTDLYMKEGVLRDRDNRIVLATATPLTNTISEMYNMTMHVMPEALENAGIRSFDAWLGTFGRTESKAEINPGGKSWRMKQRIRGFKNGNELMSIYRQFADIKQTSDVVKDLPKAERIDVICESSAYQKALLNSLDKRAQSVGRGGKDDNMLTVSSDGRAAATDLRLVRSLLDTEELFLGVTNEELDVPGSKINRCVSNIMKEYRESSDRSSTQFVFLDLGVKDSGSRYSFNLYNDLINKLVNEGIPRSEIANIQDYDGEDARSKLYDLMNTGKVRVLIGSTQKMGEGVNAQKKAVALHHLSVPFRPDNIEQREGRIIRHGNENKNVRIYRYIQQESFDTYLWQMLERKADYIHDAFNGGDATDLEDTGEVSMDYRTIKAISTGNPIIGEKFTLEDKIKKLNILKDGWIEDVVKAKKFLASSDARLSNARRSLEARKADAQTVKAQMKEGENRLNHFSVNGKTFETRDDLAAAFKKASKTSGKVGTIYGVDIVKGINEAGNPYVKIGSDHQILLGDSTTGNIERIFNAVNFVADGAVQAVQRQIDALEASIAESKEIAESDFSHEEELSAAMLRLTEINEELGINSAAATIEVPTVDENGEEFSGEEEYDISGDVASYDVAYDAETDTSAAKFSPHDPSRWTAERNEGAESKPVRSVSEIIATVEHDFGINVTEGHMRNPKNVRGFFNPENNGIRIREAGNLPTAVHELGHGLDEKYSIVKNLPSDIKKEIVDNLGGHANGYKKAALPREGVAEFVRKYLQNKDSATRDYPLFSDWFLRKLSAEDYARFDQLADDINNLYANGRAGRNTAIRMKENAMPRTDTLFERAKEFRDTYVFKMRDTNIGIKRFSEEAGDDTAYILATNSAYSDAVGSRMISGGDLVDPDGKYVGAGLAKALSGINLDVKVPRALKLRYGLNIPIDKMPGSEYADFGEYLVCKHGPERLREGMRVFNDDVMDTAAWMNGRAEELEAMYPQFKEAAEALYEFQTNFLITWGVKTGLVSKESAAQWIARWKYYVPLNRVVENGSSGGTKKGYVNQVSGIHKAKGSGLDIIHPVDNIMYNILNMVNAATRNRVASEISNLVEKKHMPASIMEKIPAPLAATKVRMEGVKDKLTDDILGSGLSDGDMETMLGIVMDLDNIMLQFDAKRRGKGRDITILKNGKPEFWRINDENLFRSMASLTQTKLGAVGDAYATISRFITGNITGNNVVWSLFSNAPRDLGTLLTYSPNHNVITMLRDIGSTYANAFKSDSAQSPFFREYLAIGGGKASYYSADREAAMKARKELARAQKKFSISPNPMDWLSFVSDTVEMGPRFATYKYLREQGIDSQHAFYAAMDVTVNFRKGGELSRELNKFIPFFNASVQGIDKFERWVSANDITNKEQRGLVAAGRITAWMTVNAILGALIYGLNNSSPEKKKDYELLSNYTKNSFWNIPMGDGKFFAIPKPRELAIPSSIVSSAMEYIVGGNKHAFDQTYEYIADNVLPNAASDVAQGDIAGAIGSLGIVGTGAYMMANRDFLGRPIVSTAYMNLEKRDQYNGRTSKAAKIIGDALNESPMMLDFLFQNTLGGFWKYQRALLPVDPKERDISLGVKNTYVKDPLYSNDIVNWLYDHADETAKSHKSHMDDLDAAISAKKDDNMTSFYSRYNKLAKGEAEDRSTKLAVLDMITDYRNAVESGEQTRIDKIINEIVAKTNSGTELLPSAMQPYVKDADGNKHNLTSAQYYEFQTLYNGLYYSYVEQTVSAGDDLSKRAAVLREAKQQALNDASAKMLKQVGIFEASKYGDVSTAAIIEFNAEKKLDDGGFKNDDATAILDGMDLDDESKAILWQIGTGSKSSKNNPWKNALPDWLLATLNN